MVVGANEPMLHNMAKQQLVDPFLEEVGEVKLEIQRVRSQIDVIRAFNERMRQKNDVNVRREIFLKVESETDNVAATLSKVSYIMNNWSETQKLLVADLLSGVIDEYRNVLIAEKERASDQLKNDLKGAHNKLLMKTDVELGNIAYQPLTPHEQDLQINVEEQYTQILRINSTLQRLYSLFPNNIQMKEDDVSVKEISDLMVENENMRNNQHELIPRKRQALFAGLSAVLVMTIIFIILLL